MSSEFTLEPGVRVEQYFHSVLEKLRRNRYKDRTTAVCTARHVASDLIINPSKYGLALREAVRLVERYGFLLEAETGPLIEMGTVLPNPDKIIKPIFEWDGGDSGPWVSETVSSRLITVDIAGYLNKRSLDHPNKSVGIIGGKWRILNAGELYALHELRRTVDHLIVVVDSDDICQVRTQDSDSPYCPHIDFRVTQLLNFRFADNSRIDGICIFDRDPFDAFLDSPIYFPLPLLLDEPGRIVHHRGENDLEVFLNMGFHTPEDIQNEIAVYRPYMEPWEAPLKIVWALSGEPEKATRQRVRYQAEIARYCGITPLILPWLEWMSRESSGEIIKKLA